MEKLWRAGLDSQKPGERGGFLGGGHRVLFPSGKFPWGKGFPKHLPSFILSIWLVFLVKSDKQTGEAGSKPPGDWHQKEGRSLACASCLSASGWRWRAPAGPNAGLLCPCVVLPRSSVPSAAPALCPSMPHPVPLTWSPWPPLPHLHAVVLIWG